ncbi:sensor histidine kinase [Arachnia propionica]|uniref:histidine kinase n=1 Tax=Arachnia propionica TaxID=1750 RepID=A0A3P1T679_9ACTN|nr:HAMP domain-containing sensor histidine kinase [Arachnia propionica]MDO5083450.1 HAMP domain-containing sensor histidine kinase [Arachnia propionica]RRD04889.1 sensor histidine kinase [Arachnia propionica]
MKRLLRFVIGPISVRIMLAVILVSGVALAMSGTIVWLFQERHLEEIATQSLQRVRARLEQEIKQPDPNTGEPYASISAVLHTHMQHSVRSPDAGEVGFLGTAVAYVTQAGTQIRPERDKDLIMQIRQDLRGTDSVIRTIETPVTRYRVLVVPISLGEETGGLAQAIDMQKASAELRDTMRQYTVVAVATVLLLIVPTWLVMGRLLRPIGELRRATDAIDENDLTTRVSIRGRDDLSALARAVNRMLDRVQAAVEAQRNLLDDVSHELRTPITIVRGHLELMDASDPEDVNATRKVSIDELDRMGALVSDLLLLAKAEQADFVVPVPTELAELTLQVLTKARALGNRDWRLEGLAEGTAVLDPGRITQAWLQLASNAVKYSAEGTCIGIGSTVVGSDVLLHIQDQGIGMSAEEMATVSTRSFRTGSAALLASGHGLGLSIVKSIAEAHGGRLEIQSEEGRGSLFTLRVPRTGPEGGEGTLAQEGHGS